MADFATYDTTNNPAGPEKPRVFGLKVISDIDILRRNGWGDTLTKVAGSTRLYDAGGGSMGMKIIQSDGTTEVEALGGEYKLRAELDCDGINGIELKYPKAKSAATGALLAVAAGNEGVQEWDATVKKPVYGADAGGKRRYGGLWDIDGTHYRRLQLNFNGFTEHAHGELTTKNGVATQGITTTPALLDLWATGSAGYGTSPTPGSGHIVIDQPGTYLVSFNASIKSSTSNTVYTFHLRKDAVEQDEGMSHKVGVANDEVEAGFSGLIDCDTNEALSIYVEVAAGTPDLTLIHGQLIVVRVGPKMADNPGEPYSWNQFVHGVVLDDVNDTVAFRSHDPIPFEYTGSHDVLMELIVRLDQAEIGTDSIDMKADYASAVIGTGTLEGATTTKTDTGVTLGAGVAAGTIHRVLIALTYNDATNPMAADTLVGGVIKRNLMPTVGSVTLLDGHLLVPCHGPVDYQS